MLAFVHAQPRRTCQNWTYSSTVSSQLFTCHLHSSGCVWPTAYAGCRCSATRSTSPTLWARRFMVNWKPNCFRLLVLFIHYIYFRLFVFLKVDCQCQWTSATTTRSSTSCTTVVCAPVVCAWPSTQYRARSTRSFFNFSWNDSVSVFFFFLSCWTSLFFSNIQLFWQRQNTSTYSASLCTVWACFVWLLRAIKWWRFSPRSQPASCIHRCSLFRLF